MPERPPQRFRGYDVLAKRDTPSWNEVTRRVIDERSSAAPSRTFFSEAEWALVDAIAGTLLPQDDREPHEKIAITPSIDAALSRNEGNGYRFEGVPPLQQFWREGLAAIDDESRARFGRAFVELSATDRIAIVKAIPPRLFAELLGRVVSVYYAHPSAWNEIGFGGPASPRGYVRLGFNQRDPWEAEERGDA